MLLLLLFSSCSGGQKSRVALADMALSDPDVVILVRTFSSNSVQSVFLFFIFYLFFYLFQKERDAQTP